MATVENNSKWMQLVELFTLRYERLKNSGLVNKTNVMVIVVKDHIC